MPREHPLRMALVNEAHARPFLSLVAPIRASHLAMTSGEGGAAVRWIDAIDGTQSAQALLVPQPASAVRSVCAPVGTVALAGCLIGLLAWRMTRLKSGSGERR